MKQVYEEQIEEIQAQFQEKEEALEAALNAKEDEAVRIVLEAEQRIKRAET